MYYLINRLVYFQGTLDIVYNAQRDGSTQLHVLQNNIAKQSCFVSVKGMFRLCLYKFTCSNYSDLLSGSNDTGILYGLIMNESPLAKTLNNLYIIWSYAPFSDP